MSKQDDKDWMLTYKKHKVHPLAFRASDVDLEDIAISMAKQCRYNGHCLGFYSVAEHSDIIRRALRRDGYPLLVQKIGLLHDTSETWTGDVIRPLKNALRTQGFDIKPYELKIEEQISAAFGLPWPWPQIIHDYDKRIVRDEKDQLKPDDTDDWSAFDIPKVGLGIKIEGWEWREAHERWLKSFYELEAEINNEFGPDREIIVRGTLGTV